MSDLSLITVVIAASVISALFAVWFLNHPKVSNTLEIGTEPISLLFEDGVLHHGTSAGLAHFALHPGTHVWDDLRASLVRQFPDMPVDAGAGGQGLLTLRATDAQTPDQLKISWRDSLCWVTLGHDPVLADAPVTQTDTVELNNLRRASASLPNPVWQEDASGKVFWFNQSYEALFQMTYGGPVDPAKRLFNESDQNTPKRVSLRTSTDHDPDWYELSVISVDGVTVFNATCINAVIAAEKAQRNFVQTLAKTFAHLSIGLAIFDRNGQLALFNPAMVDLTGLPAHFLSARPTMLSFFDQLRENRRMPEPKNYLNWRQEIAEVIAAATDGRYQETWSLESGQTYRIKGRPHPDGATAFLIEDISAEVALTRNFRAELELGQSLIDTLDDGLAVFSAGGVLTFTNTAYRNIWQQEPQSSFADVTIHDCLSVWQDQSERNPLWQKVEDYIGTMDDRKKWRIPIILKNGGLVTCQLVPIASGATLLRFRYQADTAKKTKALVQNSLD